MPHAHLGATEINYEAFGDVDDPAVLFIAGLTSQLTSWPDDFCMAFVDRGFRVIRFDNRDSGLSTVFPDGAEYSLSDMAADVAGLIDLLDAAPAHIVGMSLGGMVAQTLAVEYPAAVASLVSIASTTGNQEFGQPTPEAWDALLLPPPTTREEAIERSLIGKRVWGTSGGWDEAEYAEWAGENFDRSNPPGAAERQFAAIDAMGDREPALALVRAPTLVIHGAQDTLIEASGGRRTAELVPGAEYLEIDGMGHDLPQLHWPEIVHAVTALAFRSLSGAE